MATDDARKIEILEEFVWRLLDKEMRNMSILHSVVHKDEDFWEQRYQTFLKQGFKISREEFDEVIKPVAERAITTYQINDDLAPTYKYQRITYEDFLPGEPKPRIHWGLSYPPGSTREQRDILFRGKHPDFPDEA